MPLRAGDMRHRVAIQSRGDEAARDAHGQPSSAFATVATRWAEVSETNGGEVRYADGTAATITHTVRLRYYSGLGPHMRLLWGTRILNIVGVTNPDGKRVEHKVECVEEVP